MADSFNTYFRTRAKALALKRPPAEPVRNAAVLRQAEKNRAAFVDAPKICPVSERALAAQREREGLKIMLATLALHERTIVASANAPRNVLETFVHPVRCTEHTHVDIQRRLAEPVHYPAPAPLKIDGVERTPEEHNLFILGELQAHRRRLAARITAIKAASK